MTREDDKDLVIKDIELPFQEKARAILTIPEYNMMTAYIEKGGHPLAPQTAAAFYNLYLNGSDCREIHRLNSSFPYESVLWARVKYNWDAQRDEYVFQLQLGIKDKMVRAQLETASFLTDVLAAARKKHGDKIKKYLQTGNDADLGNAMNVDTIHGLLKAVEGLQKITGQDRETKIRKEETLNVNVNTTPADSTLSSDSAAKILSIVAEEKRRKQLESK